MKKCKFDLHVHTAEVSPCGKVKAQKVVNLYKKAGYKGMVITDHFRSRFFNNYKDNISWEKQIEEYLEGFYQAKKYGEKLGLVVLPGLEIRFPDKKNDYLIFGVDEEFLKKHKNIHEMGLEKFYQFKQEVDREILIYQAHPFRNKMTIVDPEFLDGVEVFNGNPRHESRNDLAFRFARRHSLKKISGSDFHELEDLDRGGIFIKKCPQTPAELVKLLKKDKIEKLITVDQVEEKIIQEM